ncbi:hypothetical protein EXT42_17205 [Pseudoalteromonas sp. CO302Y]|uniref:hypothetical protein n=1 Tax=unclassified Pseudoalteromonas TaxID=194690 RepID=UPI0010239FA3|nr:hypothetical protein EXT42_17205 [Pseudoalteromonas sp. CO302Y]RZG05992.1 hypothetical protein EXT40_17210 [Pseudoalteromonas sp. CO133X]
MSTEKAFSDEELIELFEFFDKTNKVFHQPLNYGSKEIIEEFATSQYPIIKKYYYEVLWEKLPAKYKERLLSE